MSVNEERGHRVVALAATSVVLKFFLAYDAGNNHWRGIACEGDLRRAEQKEYGAFMEMSATSIIDSPPQRPVTGRRLGLARLIAQYVGKYRYLLSQSHRQISRCDMTCSCRHARQISRYDMTKGYNDRVTVE